MAEDQIPTEKIAQDGDLILVVGDPKQARLLVASATLKSSSPVFAALLSSKYREGQEVGTSSNPKEIELLEDDTFAMSGMCNLLHGKRFSYRTGVMPSEQIFQLSVVIDKYGCAEALYYQSQAILLMWLTEQQTPKMIPSCQIAAAAFLLHQPKAFHLATQRLTMNTSGDYAVLRKDQWGEALPIGVLFKFSIERRRTLAYNRIRSKLPKLGIPHCERNDDESLYGSESINYDEGFLNRLCTAFQIPFWPPNFAEDFCSVSEAIEKIQTIDAGELAVKTCDCNDERTEVTAAEFKTFTQEVAGDCFGMCLQCARAGRDEMLRKCNDKEHR